MLAYTFIVKDLGTEERVFYSIEYEYPNGKYILFWHPIAKESYLCVNNTCRDIDLPLIIMARQTNKKIQEQNMIPNW
jgi:hypothetical protein